MNTPDQPMPEPSPKPTLSNPGQGADTGPRIVRTWTREGGVVKTPDPDAAAQTRANVLKKINEAPGGKMGVLAALSDRDMPPQPPPNVNDEAQPDTQEVSTGVSQIQGRDAAGPTVEEPSSDTAATLPNGHAHSSPPVAFQSPTEEGPNRQLSAPAPLARAIDRSGGDPAVPNTWGVENPTTALEALMGGGIAGGLVESARRAKIQLVEAIKQLQTSGENPQQLAKLLKEYKMDAYAPFLRAYNITSPEWLSTIPNDGTPEENRAKIKAHLERVKNAAEAEGTTALDVAFRIEDTQSADRINNAFFDGQAAILITQHQVARPGGSTFKPDGTKVPNPDVVSTQITIALDKNHSVSHLNTGWEIGVNDNGGDPVVFFHLTTGERLKAGSPFAPSIDYQQLAERLPLPRDLNDPVVEDIVDELYPFLVLRDQPQEPPLESTQWDRDAEQKFTRAVQGVPLGQPLPLISQIPTDRTAFFTASADTGFPFHFLKPQSMRASHAEPMTRAYLTINPDQAANIQNHFVSLTYLLLGAGIDFEAKAASPSEVFQRADNMVFYFPDSQRENAQLIIQQYLQENGLGQGHVQTAAPDEIEGLSWSPEPDAQENALVDAVNHRASSPNRYSYNQLVAARLAPYYLRRWERACREIGLDQKADKIRQRYLEMQDVIRRGASS
ncbi:MAG TPA: T3SS effector HopA1 family protein [Candidatus Saccharimonadales bacterium]|nr:T3SS effector HopA1 family protein [Candidatus Saccharimonadales bacterium]